MRPRLEGTTPLRSASSRRGGGPAASDPLSAGRGADPLIVLRCLTDRDRCLVSVLAEHQVLTTTQVTQLAFPSLDVAQRRLLRLTRLGILDRFRWHALVGSEAWHYTLGPAGAALVAAERGVEAPRPADLRRRALRLAASPRLAHLLGVNGWFCALAEEARTHPGTALVAWWSERRCAEHYGELVRPDAYGAWTENGRQVEFFVEYDTGTEPLARLTAKLGDYAELAVAGGPDHPVLYWLPSTIREAHLHQLLAQRPPTGPVATATAEAAAALDANPAGPLWLTPGSQRRRPLIDLATLATGRDLIGTASGPRVRAASRRVRGTRVIRGARPGTGDLVAVAHVPHDLGRRRGGGGRHRPCRRRRRKPSPGARGDPQPGLHVHQLGGAGGRRHLDARQGERQLRHRLLCDHGRVDLGNRGFGLGHPERRHRVEHSRPCTDREHPLARRGTSRPQELVRLRAGRLVTTAIGLVRVRPAGRSTPGLFAHGEPVGGVHRVTPACTVS